MPLPPAVGGRRNTHLEAFSLKDLLILASFRALMLLAAMLPRWAAEPLCWIGGLLWWAIAPRAREAVRANLRQVLNREPSASEVRAVFRHGALNYWDTAILPRLSRAALLSIVSIDGWEHLDGALAEGRGVVLVGDHVGSAAMAASAISARGYDLTTVIEPAQRPVFDLLVRLRGAHGTRVLPAGSGAVRPLLGALRRNAVVGLISDRDVLGTGPPVQFFGAQTTFPEGAAALALRTGAPVLLAVAHRGHGGVIRGELGLPIPFAPSGDARSDVRALTQAIATRLEYHIGAHPEQWTVFQRRWPEAPPPRP